MSHLSEQILRRYVDEPDALLSYEKEHLLQCGVCRSRLDQVRERAAFAAHALHTDDSVDLQAAHLKLTGLLKRPHTGLATKGAREFSPRVTQWAGAVAAVFALFILIGYAPVRTYAQNFLSIFEPHQFQPIGITTADLQKLQSFPGLKKYGTMHETASPGFVGYHDLSAATRDSGYAILRPHFLPAGIPAEVLYHVSRRNTASFTFSSAKAPDLPPNLNRATLNISAGPITVQTFGEKRAFEAVKKTKSSRHFPRTNGPGIREIPQDMLVVTQSPQIHVYSSGASLAQIEAYLLAQPGLPASVVKQLHAIADPASTLPVPINIDKQTAQQVVIHGSNALLIGDNTGVGAIAVWQQNGMVYCVAGPYAASVIVQVANSLAP